MAKITLCIVLVLLGATQMSAELKKLKEFCVDPGTSQRCFSLYYDTDGSFIGDGRARWDRALQQCMSQGKRLAVLDDKTVLDSVSGNFSDLNHADFRKERIKIAWTALRMFNNTEWLDGRKAEGITIEGDWIYVYAAMEAVSPSVSQLTFIARHRRRASICLLPMGDCRSQQPGDKQHITASGVCLVYVNDVDYWKESTCQKRGGELAVLSQSVTKDDVSALLNKATDKRGWLGLTRSSVLEWGLPYGHSLPLSNESHPSQRTSFSNGVVRVLYFEASQASWSRVRLSTNIPFRICEDVPGIRYTTSITPGSSEATPLQSSTEHQTAATPDPTSRTSIEMRVIIGVICFILIAAALGLVVCVYQFKKIRDLTKRLDEPNITPTAANSDPAPMDPSSVDADHSDTASLNDTSARDSYQKLQAQYVNVPNDHEGPNQPYAEIRVGY